MDIMARLARHITSHFETVRDAPIGSTVSPEEVRKHLRKRYDFAQPVPVDDLFDDVTQMMWRWAEHSTNPMHYGLYRPMVDPVSVVADTLVAMYDPNLATWDFAPAAQEIERHVLDVIADRFGHDLSNGIAQFTSGGQEANHSAVAVALTHRFPEVAKGGLRGLPGQPVFYLSEEGHHSFEKVAHSTGLGRGALRFVPAKLDLKIDLDALGKRVERDRDDGFLPFMLIGTAGTTNAGTVDPLPALADQAARHGMWFHVDAAWGGAAALSDRLRPVLAGMERADSITCDAHKWFSVPAGAGMFFCRDRNVVEATFAAETAYVPDQATDGRIYPFNTSMQWSRRFIGLKLFMMLAARGIDEITQRIEHQTEMGEYLKRTLVSRGWRLLNDTPLPVACFNHPLLKGVSGAEAGIVQRLKDEQIAWISKTLLRGKVPALRACITNFNTRESDVDRLVDALDSEVRRVSSGPQTREQILEERVSR